MRISHAYCAYAVRVRALRKLLSVTVLCPAVALVARRLPPFRTHRDDVPPQVDMVLKEVFYLLRRGVLLLPRCLVLLLAPSGLTFLLASFLRRFIRFFHWQIICYSISTAKIRKEDKDYPLYLGDKYRGTDGL